MPPISTGEQAQECADSAPSPAPQFGSLLKCYRMAAGLTQHALAERSGMSARGISDLERGVRSVPQKRTLARLARALPIAALDRLALEAAAQQQCQPPHSLRLSGRHANGGVGVTAAYGSDSRRGHVRVRLYGDCQDQPGPTVRRADALGH